MPQEDISRLVQKKQQKIYKKPVNVAAEKANLAMRREVLLAEGDHEVCAANMDTRRSL